jgi:uncharacterized protein
MTQSDFRSAITQYIRLNAKPVDKFSHQPRLYSLASKLGQNVAHDDDVLYAAAWLHDLGVFVGHRPEELSALASWDWIAYAIAKAPALLEQCGFPKAKVPGVLEAIRTHLPSSEPATIEGVLLRDADILEQLGAVGILRTLSKIGRDTRFVLFSDALKVLRKNVNELPGKLKLEISRHMAEPKIQALQAFLTAAEIEANGIAW